MHGFSRVIFTLNWMTATAPLRLSIFFKGIFKSSKTFPEIPAFFLGSGLSQKCQSLINQACRFHPGYGLVWSEGAVLVAGDDPQVSKSQGDLPGLPLPQGRGEVGEGIECLRGVARSRVALLPGIQEIQHSAGDSVGALLLEVQRGEEFLLHRIGNKKKL